MRRRSSGAERARVEGGKSRRRKRFKAHPIGCFDLAEVRAEEGKPRLFVAVDRARAFASARPVAGAGKMEAARFPRDLLAEAGPYRSHTVLTDNGIRSTARERDTHDGRRLFDRARAPGTDGVGHRLTRVNHPWTDGQVERMMNRALKDATVERQRRTGRGEPRAHPTSSSSGTPATTPAASRRRAASPPTGSSAGPRPSNRNGSDPTRHPTPRNRTARARGGCPPPRRSGAAADRPGRS